MVGRYFSIVMTVLIIYAMMSWPMFVLGIYCGHLRRVAKHSAKRHLVSSWLLVIAGFLLLFGCCLAEKIIDWPTDPSNLILGAVTAVSAVPAGAAYSILEKKHWRALVPPVTGIISQAFIFGTMWFWQRGLW